VEKVEKKHEKRESHARWLEKRKAKGNKKIVKWPPQLPKCYILAPSVSWGYFGNFQYQNDVVSTFPSTLTAKTNGGG
jgi:hypothetical protein